MSTYIVVLPKKLRCLAHEYDTHKAVNRFGFIAVLVMTC